MQAIEEQAARIRLTGLCRLTDPTPTTCPDCDRTLPRGKMVNGYCPVCWLKRARLSGAKSNTKRSARTTTACALCGRERVLRRGLCSTCYKRWQRSGKPMDPWGAADVDALQEGWLR
jgi:predicted amidophosphoribosyltransferase